MFKVKVPATTANMGPGFDAIGMALKLYNEFEIEKIKEGIEVIGCEIPLEENLVYTTIKKVLRMYNHKEDGFRMIHKKNDVPVSRGLGSSATCIVSGIMMANYLMGNPLNEEDIIRIGTKIEGHPDNIVPAVIGGLTVSIYEDGQVVYSKVNVPESLRFAVMIPDFKVSTHDARGVLPDSYKKNDCIFNISRVAILVAAMNNGEIENLRYAMEDKIHQPYRAKLIPEIEKVFEYAKKFGAKAEVISGSGSTLMAVIDKENTDFSLKMEETFKDLKGDWKIKILPVDEKGAQIL